MTVSLTASCPRSGTETTHASANAIDVRNTNRSYLLDRRLFVFFSTNNVNLGGTFEEVLLGCPILMVRSLLATRYSSTSVTDRVRNRIMLRVLPYFVIAGCLAATATRSVEAASISFSSGDFTLTGIGSNDGGIADELLVSTFSDSFTITPADGVLHRDVNPFTFVVGDTGP